MSLDLYQDETRNRLSDLSLTDQPVQTPGVFDGFFRGSGMLAVREGVRAARAVSMLGAAAPIAFDAFTGGTTMQDRYFQTHEQVFKPAVDYWTPKPGEVGMAAEVVGPLLGMLPQLFAAPMSLVASTFGAVGEDLVAEGAPLGKSLAVAGVQAGGLATGIWMPILGQTGWQRMLIGGAGFNVLQGAATRAASGAIMTGTQWADAFPALDPTMLTVDALLGLGFGAFTHLSPPQRAQGTAAWNRLREFFQANTTPEQRDALATMRVAEHLNTQTAPGRPAEATDLDAHVQRVRQAIDDLASDRPVRVEDLPEPRFEPEPERLAEMETRVQELARDAEDFRIAEDLPPPPDPEPARPAPAVPREQLIGTTARELPPEAQPKAIGQEIEQRLREIGADEKEARANGAIWSAFFETASARYGRTAADLVESYGLDIRKVAPSNEGRLAGVLDEALEQPAWHGSPHVFDRFSLHKIGSGEGAQAYGWGLYFSKLKEIGQWYRDKLTEGRGKFYFEALSNAENEALPNWVRNSIGRAVDPEAKLKEQIAEFDKRLKENKSDLRAEKKAENGRPWLVEHKIQSVRETLTALRKLRGRAHAMQKAGRLYQVEIPDDDVMLDYNKPLTEQPPKVQTALREAGYLKEPPPRPKVEIPKPDWWVNRNARGVETARIGGAVIKPMGKALDLPPRDSDEWVYFERMGGGGAGAARQIFADAEAVWLNDARRAAEERAEADYQRLLRASGFDSTGADLYNRLARESGVQVPGMPRGVTQASPEAASRHLAELGIKGIKYRGRTTNEENYVVFDDNLIQIQRFEQPAWHGTHAEIDKFSTQYIGTGEGAQVKGWGLYFSSKKAVGEWYRKTVTQRRLGDTAGVRFTRGDEQINGNDLIPMLAEYFKPGRRVPGFTGVDEVIRFIAPETYTGRWSVDVRRVEERGKPVDPNSVDGRIRRHSTLPEMAEIQKALEADGWTTKRAGRLYQVEIPEREEMLDWDRPLTKSPQAQALYAVYEKAERLSGRTPAQNLPQGETGRNLYEHLVALASEGLIGVKKPRGPADPEIADAMAVLGDKFIVERDPSDSFWAVNDIESGDIYVAPGAARQFENDIGPDKVDAIDTILEYLKADKFDPQEAASKFLLEHGIQGITYKGASSGERNFVVFDDSRIEITRYEQSQRQKGALWYSELERQIDAANMKQAPAKAWLDLLKGMKGKGVKDAELEATGIREWLELQEGKLTKAQVLEYLQSNGVQVKEVELGGPKPSDLFFYEMNEKYGEGWSSAELTPEEQARNLELWNAANRTGERENDTKYAGYQLPGAKQGSYRELLLTLPTRDPELGQPTKAAKSASDYYADDPDIDHVLRYLDGMVEIGVRTDGQYHLVLDRNEWVTSDLQSLERRLATWAMHEGLGQAARPDAFLSSHFDPPNILAHVRFNERTDAEGKRVLFLEELQSDWAQKGRSEGFNTGTAGDWRELSNSDLDRLARYIDSASVSRGTDATKVVTDWMTDQELTHQQVTDLYNREIPRGRLIPSAPFVTKTEAWTALVLKRMIRYASENGFDRIAWTRGEQQVDRYNKALREAVDSVEWTKTKDGVHLQGYKRSTAQAVSTAARNDADDAIRRNDYLGFDTVTEARAALRENAADWRDRWEVPNEDDAAAIQNYLDLQRVSPNTEKVVDTTEKETALSDAIGKAMAEKILSDPNQSGTLEGPDLKISDTGMAGYYDRIVPGVLRDVAKKLGGGKVGQTEIDLPSTRAQAPDFQTMGDAELEAFGGAENFTNGDAPLSARGQLLIDGTVTDGTFVVDRHGMQFIDDDSSIAVMFDAGEITRTRGYETNSITAMNSIENGWQTQRMWEHPQVIVGEASEVRPVSAARETQPSFDITPAMREAALAGMPLFQDRMPPRAPEAPRADIQFGRGRTLISLFEGADASSFLHETGHFFLQMTRDLATHADAPELAKQDWATLQQHLGFSGREIPREAHEQFARSFEAYLAEGKAPSSALAEVFAQFKSWLLSLYRSIAELDVNLTPELRGVFDRMLATAPEGATPRTEGPIARDAAASPPPRAGAPEAVGPEAEPWERRGLEDDGVRQILGLMVEAELGWEQIGGKLDHARLAAAGGKMGTVAFTEWIPKAEWWRTRPGIQNRRALNEAKIEAAVKKALAGQKMTKLETLTIEHMIDVANERLASEQRLGPEEWNETAADVAAEDLAPTTQNVDDADLIARANEIDEAAVERAAMQAGEDDLAFMAAIREIVDGRTAAGEGQGAEAAQGGPQDGPAPRAGEPGTRTPAPDTAGAPGRLSAPAGTAGGQADTLGATGRGAEPPDPLTAAADRFASEHGELLLEVGVDEAGNPITMSPAEYLEGARLEAQMAREDLHLFEIAAECLLGGQ